MIKPPAQGKDLGKKEVAHSHPVNHTKSHGRQSQWAVKQLDDKINEANMNVASSPKKPVHNVPL
jgi:hypothetical protein